MESSQSINQPRIVHKAKLLRVLGIAFGLAITIGGVIGAGIIRTPGQVAAQLPNAWLFLGVWIAGGLYTLLCAPSIAELGTMVPRSGGLYVFAHRALGNYAGFIVGWSDWLGFCGTLAALAIIVGELAGRLFPAFAGKALTVAAVILVAFTALQWLGIRWGSFVQQLTSLLKVLAFVALGAAAFIFGGGNESDTNVVAQSIPTGLALFSAFVIAFQGVIFTYDGYYAVVYYSEELQDPARDIPRSMFSSIFLVIGIYLLINISVLYALPMSQIAGNEFVGGTLAQAIFGARGDTIITVLIIITTLGAVNSGFWARAHFVLDEPRRAFLAASGES